MNTRNSMSKIFTAAAAAALALSAGVTYADITTGLVLDWTMNQSTGTTVVNSAPGGSSADNGTVNTASDTAWVPDAPGGGYALQLNTTGGPAQSGYVSTSGSSDVALSTYTLSCWMNLDYVPPSSNGATNPGLFNSRFNGGHTDIQIENASTSTAGYARGVHADIGSSSGYITTGADAAYQFYPHTWYLITYAVQTGSVDIYVNGVLAKSYADGGTAPLLEAGGFNVGSGAGSGTAVFLPAAIADFTIYNRVLSSSDVAQLYNSAIPEPATLGLMAVMGAGLPLIGRKRRRASY